jgi:putative heme transporter
VPVGEENRKLTENGKDQHSGEEKPPPVKKHSLLKRLVMIAMTLAIVGVVFFYLLPKFASYKSVFQAMSELSLWQLGLLLAVAIFNLVCAWSMNQAALPGMKTWQAAQLTLSQNMIASSLPMGAAFSVGFGYQIIHSYGFDVSEYSMMLSVSGIWNTFAKLALPVVALLVLVVTGDAKAGMAWLTLIGMVCLVAAIGIFALILWKPSLARRLGDLAGRGVSRVLRFIHRGPVTTWGEGLERFRDQTVIVAKSRWLVLTIIAIIYQLSTFMVYLLAIRFSGVPASGEHGVSLAITFGVFAFTRLISAIPITPGAVGIAEASYTSLMVAAGGSQPEVVAGVLLFRALTWLMPIALGLPAYASWWVWERKKKKAPLAEGIELEPLAEEEA